MADSLEITLPDLGWTRILLGRRRALRCLGDAVMLVEDEKVLGQWRRSQIRLVELHRVSEEDGGGAGFRVDLATQAAAVTLVPRAGRIPARALAERLARGLALPLQDFTGTEMTIRQPDQLDRPSLAATEDPGPAPAGLGLRVVERDRQMVASWAAPAVGPALGAAGLGVLASLAGRHLLAAGFVVLVALFATLRQWIQLGPDTVRLQRGWGGISLGATVRRPQLEQVLMESGPPARLVLVSDLAAIELEGSPERLDWLRRKLLAKLTQTG